MRSILTAFFGAIVLGGTSLGQVVYDNLPATAHPFANAVLQGGQGGSYGDKITLAGTARRVSIFETEVQNSSFAFLADVSLRFFNVEPGDLVGTQIGSTVTQTGVSINGPTIIQFSGLSLTVPGTIIYQVSIENGSVNSSYQWGVANSPAVGSSDNSFHYLGTSNPFGFGWAPFNNGSDGNPSVTITAVPEPSASFLPFVILSFTVAIWGRRRVGRRIEAPATRSAGSDREKHST